MLLCTNKTEASYVTGVRRLIRIAFLRVRYETALDIAYYLLDNRPDDQYIVAHERSGSTWLRTMLCNLLYPQQMSDPHVFQFHIPIIRLKRVVLIHNLPSPRILMSHTNYRPNIRRAVYMVRDGRDAVVSFYHFLVTRHKRDQVAGFGDFFDRYMQGAYGSFWPRDVEAWLTRGQQALGNDLLVLRFEDLKRDPHEHVAEVATFLGISFSPAQLAAAVDAAAIEQMRQREAQREGTLQSPDHSFYRGGRTGQWQEYFTPEMEQRFQQRAAHVLKLAGYH